jgi:GT2 family glycosyltransferase
MNNVYISIINFNGKKNTLACLESLKKLHTKNVELSVVVVDNDSYEPFSLDKKKYKNFSVELIKSAVNTGFSGGHNLGITYALDHGADYVIVLNNDTIVHEDMLEELVRAAEKNEIVGIVAPKIYFTKGSEYHKDRYAKNELGKVFWYAGGIIDWANLIGKHRGVDEVDKGQYDAETKTDFASGCCFLIKREVIEKVGMFDTKYFLYYEDNDLCERVKRADYSILYMPSAVLWHTNAASTGGSGSKLQDYFISRNRLLFGFRYASMRTKVALMRESFRLLRNGRPGQQKGIVDFYLRRFGKGSYTI